MNLDTITREEFDSRVDLAKERLRQELAEVQERVRRLDDLISRREVFSQKLDKILVEVEHDEAKIVAAERELRSRRSVTRRYPQLPA